MKQSQRGSQKVGCSRVLQEASPQEEWGSWGWLWSSWEPGWAGEGMCSPRSPSVHLQGGGEAGKHVGTVQSRGTGRLAEGLGLIPGPEGASRGHLAISASGLCSALPSATLLCPAIKKKMTWHNKGQKNTVVRDKRSIITRLRDSLIRPRIYNNYD